MTEVEQEKEASQNGCLEDANVSDKVRQGTNETRLASGKHILHNEAFAALNNLLLSFTNNSGSQNPAGACICNHNSKDVC